MAKKDDQVMVDGEPVTVAPPPEALPRDEAVDAIEEALQDEGQSREAFVAERMAANYAPPLDPGDPRPREVKERIAREAAGLTLTEHPRAAHLRGTLKGRAPKRRVPTVAEQTADEDAARAPQYYGVATTGVLDTGAEHRGVTINGATVLVPTGDEVRVPGPIAEVLDNAANPIRTEQMKGGGSFPVIDLRDLNGD
jgi:hypothetical protein